MTTLSIGVVCMRLQCTNASAVTSFTTVGYGDIFPETLLGKILVPLVTSVGILLIGTEIFAIRNVALVRILP